MQTFWMFTELGARHIADWRGYDHILFLVALCSIYTFADWRKLLLIVTSFTIGHSLTLFLAAFEVVDIDTYWVELGIVVTIAITGFANLTKPGQNRKSNLKIYFAGFFGLIHGLGFSRYYNMIAEGNPWVSLPAFTLGIELGQVAIVLAFLVLGWILMSALKIKLRDWNMVISGAVIGIALVMILERLDL